jgi:hypothetical protein
MFSVAANQEFAMCVVTGSLSFSKTSAIRLNRTKADLREKITCFRRDEHLDLPRSLAFPQFAEHLSQCLRALVRFLPAFRPNYFQLHSRVFRLRVYFRSERREPLIRAFFRASFLGYVSIHSYTLSARVGRRVSGALAPQLREAADGFEARRMGTCASREFN